MSFKNLSLALGCISVLGVAACTITSGTVDDTDIRSVDPNQNPTTGTDSGTDAATSDATTDTGPTCTPSTAQTVKFDSACQACLDTSCCTQLNGCYDKVTDPTNDGTCNDIQECYATCKTAPDPAGCAAGCPTAYPALTTEYDAIKSCAASSCASACPNF